MLVVCMRSERGGRATHDIYISRLRISILLPARQQHGGGSARHLTRMRETERAERTRVVPLRATVCKAEFAGRPNPVRLELLPYRVGQPRRLLSYRSPPCQEVECVVGAGIRRNDIGLFVACSEVESHQNLMKAYDSDYARHHILSW